MHRLDAVQDLINHPSFEGDFTDVTKGLPDLERIVSRIHAKNCKVKDFLKVLTVCGASFVSPDHT
jgi:DNA mismatch repair protein MSH6